MNKRYTRQVTDLLQRIKKKVTKTTGDDYGYEISVPSKEANPYNYDLIYKRLTKLIDDFDLRKMKKIVGSDFGINPLDLFVLKSFIEKNKIKNILELGAGTSSLILDNLKIHRKSFALESIFYDVPFEKIDLYIDYRKAQDFIINNNIDMILIDCEHSKRMAKLIDTKFLSLINYSKPIFLHDWHNYDKKTYAEQVYYFNNLLDKYEVTYMTDLPNRYIYKLRKMNNQIDNEEYYKKLKLRKGHLPVPRCSAILTPKNI